jgi:small subunit ribosomal protein S4e
MHQTRAQASKRLPIPRKGTKYVARALVNTQESVPVVIAVRDMLKLARNAKEVKKMIFNKALKINGKEAKDLRDSIQILNLFEADKTYILTLTQNGKFMFEETKDKTRPCKILNKTSLRKGEIQLNLHDGTNAVTKEKFATNDTVYLDEKGNISKHVKFEKGKPCIIIKGRYSGKKGKITDSENGSANVKIDNTDVETTLTKREVVVL